MIFILHNLQLCTLNFQGITVKIDERAELVIARILAGSMIDKQGS